MKLTIAANTEMYTLMHHSGGPHHTQHSCVVGNTVRLITEPQHQRRGVVFDGQHSFVSLLHKTLFTF